MVIYVGLKIYCVSLYEIQAGLNHFSVILQILLHDIICVTDIQRLKYLRKNTQFNICKYDKMSYYV